MTQTKAKAGRKPLADGEGKTARIEIRVLPETKVILQATADELGKTMQGLFEHALAKTYGIKPPKQTKG